MVGEKMFSCIIIYVPQTYTAYYYNIIRTYKYTILYIRCGTMVVAAAANGNLFTKGRR